MKIIITMAGEGSRFKKVGVQNPKHEIEVEGKTLFEWSLLSLSDFFAEEFLFIVRKNNFDKEFIEKKCRILGIEKYNMVIIDELTDGQATTVLFAEKHVNPEDSIVVYNIDTYIKEFSLKKEDIKDDFDGFIPVFPAEGNKWSFIKLDESGKVIDVVEKVRISNMASIGFYYFRSWKLFKESYLKGSEKIKKEFKEVYIAPIYKELIVENKKIGYSILKKEDVYILGTPEDLEKFKI